MTQSPMTTLIIWHIKRRKKNQGDHQARIHLLIITISWMTLTSIYSYQNKRSLLLQNLQTTDTSLYSLSGRIQEKEKTNQHTYVYENFSYFRMGFVNLMTNIFTNVMCSTNTTKRVNLQAKVAINTIANIIHVVLSSNLKLYKL